VQFALARIGASSIATSERAPVRPGRPVGKTARQGDLNLEPRARAAALAQCRGQCILAARQQGQILERARRSMPHRACIGCAGVGSDGELRLEKFVSS
jgi:hypothetical protein